MTSSNPFDGHELISPRLSLADAASLLRDRYDREGSLRPLGSHQDQNFRVDAPDGRFVLKISNPGFTTTGLEAQNAAMLHLAAHARDFRVPVPLPDVDGALISRTHHDGRDFDVRLVTYLEGLPLAEAQHLAPTVQRAHGALAARAARALEGFDHPGLDRILQWDCRHARDVVVALAPYVVDEHRRRHVVQQTERAHEALVERAGQLRLGVVHADVTDVNVVCTRDPAGRLVPDGLIDFGDISNTWIVSDLAVAVVSLVIHDLDQPLQVAREVLRGFHDVLPLTEPEVAALWPLVIARAALCTVSSEQQAQLEPHNEYAQVSRDDDWRVWDAVSTVPWPLAAAALQEAVGHPPLSPPVPLATLLRGARPVLPELAADAPVLDLSATSDLLRGDSWLDVGASRRVIEGALAHGQGVGRYGEGRLVHARPHQSSESPTIHLGVDVFAPAGSVVHAPLDGVVSLSAAREFTLHHTTGEQALDVRLAGIEPRVDDGQHVTAGAVVGTIDPAPDGDPLPPHVHVQLCLEPGLPVPGLAPPSLAAAWRSLCPDPSALVGRLAAAPPTDPHSLARRRSRVLAEVQEHYYASPPEIERGWRHFLVDTDARVYLDMVNNVAVLGHSHPAVEQAVSRQLRLLNTNSRFHYEAMVAFGERLTALLPDPLDTVLLVGSGSEANEVALRLVRSATGQRDILAVQSAYHGWTIATDEISTSLVDNPRAESNRPPWVHPVESPNTFRGRFRGPDAGHRYAADVRRALDDIRALGRGVAGFIAEPVYGNAGGLVLPDGYLAEVYDMVRAAGGLCIADEVQVGYGRLGHHFWAFEQQGVLPDVVSVAKATANGLPVGAVVTTRAIADAFAAEGSFFSSTGGSPASSVAALAVLDTLQAEGLPQNAAAVGDHLKQRLEQLSERHPIIGAVHGMGLYLGVELVRDPESLTPATHETDAICDRLLQLSVVVQPTGDHLNVLKVKPPLCLTRESADYFVDCLDRVISEGW